ncbi:Kelch-like protein 12 [Sparganum proliferum]
MAVVMFAKMMKLSNLENWGVQFMANRANLENLATTWDFAKSMRMGSLMKTCINLMQEQFRSFVSTDLFVRLPADTVLTLLRNDHLSVDSEEAVFEAISSWVGAGDKECDNERLRLHAPEMLKEVRWCQTNAQFRSRLVDSHPMFQESTSCARLMAQVEQWIYNADKDKPLCPFNRRWRAPQAIFFLVFGKDKDQGRWSVLRFDPQLEKEERIADMEKREDATYSLVGESIFVVGGDTAQGMFSTSVEEFLVAEWRWRKRASLAVGRSYHAAAVLTEAAGEALIGVFGGFNGNAGPLSSCEVYEVSRDRWFKLPDLREKRSVTAAACLPGDSRVFVFGGYNGSSRLASVEFCHLRADWRERATSSDFWQPAAPMRTARCQLAATHFRGKIIVAGGHDGRNRLNVVELFTPPDARCPRGQWTELAGMKEPRAFFALLASTDDAIFALGCWEGSGNTVETFTAPGGSADVSNDLTAWIWSSKKPLETLAKIAGAASIRI